MIRALIAGLAIAVIAPMIGTFLVLRRFSLFADSLAHVALTGVAIGIITGIYPIITAIITCIIAALAIEKLRSNHKIYTDAALSLFLSGSLALALVLISIGHGFNANLFSYLFGSITAVNDQDILIILALSIVVATVLLKLYRKLFFMAFDEESAKVSGLPVKQLNLLFITMAAVTIALSMRIVGILMVGALMVIPVLSALQVSRSFRGTFLFSIIFSLSAVMLGLILSFYLDIIAGGAIVIVALLIFIGSLFAGNRSIFIKKI